MAEIKYIIFALGKEKYGMQLSKVNGLEPLSDIIPFPVSEKNVKGIIHLRGEIVTIYSLKAHFSQPETARTESSQFIISESHGIKLGFEVDNVLGIVPVSDEEMRGLPGVVGNSDTNFVERVIKVTLPEQKNAELLLSINVDGLMPESVFENIKAAVEEQAKEEACENEPEETEATDSEDEKKDIGDE